MRTDDGTARESFRKSSGWAHNPMTGETNQVTDQRMIAGDEIIDGKIVVHSLSGKERNHFFLNLEAGREFANLSALSGLDSVADGRGFCLLDYDQDGWQDVAVVNANSPLLQLYHNDIAQVPGVRGGMIAIRFVGGNRAAAPSGLSNRDGYGAIVEVALSGGVKLKREHRCGEGFATQNSSTMIVGIGDRGSVESVTVRWPSGKTTSAAEIAEGTLLTAYEDREAGAFTQAAYRREVHRRIAAPTPAERKFPLATSGAGGLQVYTTTATWCAACLGHLPALARLKQEGGVELFGVPIDPDDDEAKLGGYVEKFKPPYQMLAGIVAGQKRTVIEFFARELQVANPVLPSSVITDAEGNVLEVMQGVPTLSQLRKWGRR